MTGILRRLVPQGLAGQLVLLLAAALILAYAAAGVLLGTDRARIAREARQGAEAERLAQIARVLSEVPAELRDDVATAASSRVLRLTVGPSPAVPETGRGRVARRIAERLREATGREARVEVVDRRRGRHGRPTVVLASLPLASGDWLNVRQDLSRRGPDGPPWSVLLPLALSLVFVLGVALVFVRRIVKPVRALAEAAERAGRGDRLARVRAGGAGEVRRAAEAFNAMQERIAAFEAERARTVAAVGHDLRTPITSLRIRAEMLDDETREAMVRTLGEMQVMADGLLAWGRSGAEREAFARVDLAALLRGLADGPSPPGAPERGGAGVSYAGPDALLVEGRPVALSRAFGNLVENARRYAGGAEVRLAAEGGEARVVVADRGPGIPEERLAAVLEPFTRVEGSRSADTGGAGLGLSIARDVVHAHGGTITLANREGGGLAVTVTLPLGDARRAARPR